MGIELLLGTHNTGKTTYIYDEIKKHSENLNQECLLIVPEQSTFYHEKKIIEHLDRDGIINIQVLSLRRLSYLLLEEIGGIKASSINDYGKIMLIRSIMDTNKENLKLFRKNFKHQGMLKELNEVINEFKLWGISPEFLSAVREGLKTDDPFANKINDIMLVYKKLNDYLKDNYLDDADVINLCIDKIKYSNYIKNSIICIDEFEDLSVSEKSFISELVQNSKKTYISVVIPTEVIDEYNTGKNDYKEEFEISKNFIDNIREIAKKNSKEIIVKKFRKKDEKITPLSFFSKEFFENESEPFLGDISEIRLSYSLNPNEEIEKIADSIMIDIREKGHRWKEIGVIMSDESVYSNDIEKVFSEYEIPYFIDTTRNIINHPLIVMILSVIDVVLWNYKFKDIMRFLKCGYTFVERNDIEELENYTLKYGINGYKWKKEFYYKKEDIDLETLRISIMEIFKKIEKLKSEDTVLNKVSLLSELLDDLKIYEKIKKESALLKNKEMHEKAFENSQIWNATIEIFEQLVNISGDAKLSLFEFRDLIKAGFEEYRLSVIPPSEDIVVVGTLGRTFIGNIENLYLVGLNEGLLPSSFKEKGILYDEERDILKNKGAKLFDTSYRSNQEKFKLSKLFNHTKTKISFSYSLSDKEGKSLRPSVYSARIRDMFPNINVKGGVINKKEIPEALRPLFNYISEKIRDYTNGKDIDPQDKAIYFWIKNEHKKFFNILNESLNFNNEAEIKNLELIEKLYSKPFNLSSYSVESYNSCPFKYFVDKGLKPYPREEYEIKYKDIGTIFHKAMELITDRAIKEKAFIFLDEKTVLNEIDKIAEESIEYDNEDNNIFEDSERNKYIKSRVKETFKISAYNLIKQFKKSEFRPVMKEVGFGTKMGSLESIEIKIDAENTVYLRGVIDRIDICDVEDNAYVSIIDYKSSNKNIDMTEVYNGLQIQLFLYMDALLKKGSKIFEKEGVFGGVFYFHVNEPFIDGDKYNEDNINKELFKKFSLQGYVIDDVEIINKLDVDFISNKESEIIKGVKLTSKNGLSSSSKVLSQKEFSHLTKIIENNIKNAAKGILSGNIEIKPYKYKDKKPCTYCDYITICQFDNSLKTNEYRKINALNEKEVIEILSKEEGLND